MSGAPRRPTRLRTSSSSSAADEASEAAVRAAPQELASVANNPASPASAWPGWMSSLASAGADYDAKPAPLPAGMLPAVRIEDFSRYLRAVGDQLAGFERDRATAQQWIQQSANPEEMRARQGQGLVQAMDEVPPLYFQPDFDLDRPELWQELGDVHSEEVRQAALDRLSRYLDSVETYLVREIAARYDSFFDASAHVQDLGASVYRLHQQVAEMRGRVAGLEREAGQGVVVAGSLRRQQANMLATLETLKAVEGVAHAQAALQAIMADATGVAVDFAAAIDVLEVLQGALDSRELLGLRCFKGLPAQIAASMQAIDDLMAADFLERTRFGGRGACLAAVSDRLRAQLAPGGAAEGEAPPGSNVQRAAQLRLRDAAATAEAGALLEAEWALRESVEDVLLPLAAGLQRMGRLGAAMRALQDASVQQLRDFIGDVVDDCLNSFGLYPQDAVHLLAGRAPPRPEDRVPKLTSGQFVLLLEAVLLAAQAFLRHAAGVGASLAAVLGQAPDVRHAASDCCHAVADAAAARWSKLLAARAQVAPSGNRLPELRDVLDMTDVLASLVEGQGVRSVLGLRTALQQLCKATLEGMHQQSVSKLTTLLDQEQWSALEVSPQCQHIVDALRLREGAGGGAPPAAAAPNGAAAGAPRPPAPTLEVAGQQFHVVQTLQLLVGMIGEYLAFRDAVPAFGADVAQRVLELLKVFNSRSCQLVLGAGAMQVSGLKSITAKHLAVCCQCVSALAALHPALAGALLQGVPRPRGDMLAAGFARALQDLNIHADEIRGKLVGMMHERLAANVKQLPVLAASWPAAAAQPAAGPPPPSSFAATTVKQLQILAGVLSPLMQPAEVRAILGSIGGMFASALAEAYDDLQPRGGGWDAQMLADLECFLSCLRELPMEAADREANLAQLAGMYQHRLRHAAAAAAEQQQQTQQQQKAQREASPPPPPRPPTAPPAGAAPQPSVAPPPPRAAEPVEPAAAQPQRGESGAHPLAEPAAAVLETEPEPEPERIEEAPATNGPAGSRPQEAAVASSPEPDDDDLGFADVDLTAS